MFKTLANAWKIEDLRKKLLFTLMIILLYRIGVAITVPFVNAEIVSNSVARIGSIGGLLTTLSSGFEQASLFALGVSPYITASIVVQLLSVAIPSLERLAKQGEEGKQKITVITRYITIAISLVTAIGYYFLIRGALINDSWYVAFLIIACFCAGSALVMWLAEKINEKGIGNGISIILFANIVSRGTAIFQDFVTKIENIYYGDPTIVAKADQQRTLFQYFGLEYTDEQYNKFIDSELARMVAEGTANPWAYRLTSIIVLLLTTIGILALIWFVVYISDSERRIPVQYAKKVVGRKMYGGRNTNLPLKVNMSGVMPVIFANAILSLPGMIFQFVPTDFDTYATAVNNGYAGTMDEYFLQYHAREASFAGHMDSFFSDSTTWFFILMTFILILAFAYFYVSISFNPVEVAGNLQQNGGSIPGIRPGKPTAMFIKKVLSKVTLIGALCLSVVAILPTLVAVILNAIGSSTPALAGLMANNSMIGEFINCGTSIIIVVGVVLETVRDMEAQMTMRHYKGFLD